jgi:hypothetical protein
MPMKKNPIQKKKSKEKFLIHNKMSPTKKSKKFNMRLEKKTYQFRILVKKGSIIENKIKIRSLDQNNKKADLPQKKLQ